MFFFFIFVALALTLGPSGLLNLTLIFLPELGGPKVNYTQAGAGFLFRTITINDLDAISLEGKPWRVTAEKISFEGISLLNTIKLVLDPQSKPNTPLQLTKNLNIKRLVMDGGPNHKISLAQTKLRNLVWLGEGTGAESSPVAFTALNLENLAGQLGQTKFTLNDLSIQELGPEILASLSLNGLEFHNAAQQIEVSIKDMTMGEVPTKYLAETLSRDVSPNPELILSTLPQLELEEGRYTRQGQEELYLATARFESLPGDGSPKDPPSFHRFISFSINSKQLLDELQLFSALDLESLCGPKLTGELNLVWTHDRQPGGQTHIREGALKLDKLGHLDISGKLSGTQQTNLNLKPAQLLFNAMSWQLIELSLKYKDLGLTPAIYAQLEQGVFLVPGSGTAAQKIQRYYLDPWLDNLREEASLADIPALEAEIQAYLSQPENFEILSQPHAPLRLTALAKMDKYDIIAKLRLSLQVNQRSPLPVTVVTEVNEEALTTVPQPMDSLFTEEDL